MLIHVLSSQDSKSTSLSLLSLTGQLYKECEKGDADDSCLGAICQSLTSQRFSTSGLEVLMLLLFVCRCDETILG